MYIHRGFLYKLMAEQGNLQGDEKARRKSLLENKSIFHNGKQRRSSWDASFSKVGWLTENQLKNFQPSCWWMYVVLFHFIHARTTTNCAMGCYIRGIFILVARVSQTSLMVLCNRQIAQASFASIITLAVINILRESWPYRRSSDNVAAYLAQWLIMLWVAGLWVFLSGLFRNIPR